MQSNIQRQNGLKNFKRLLFFLLIFCLFINCKKVKRSEKEIDIAIYSDQGCWGKSVLASEEMFKSFGFKVVLVDAEFIIRGELDNCKILCIPGGDMFHYSSDLQERGRENIKSFIRSGGAYIGICGGAYFASEKVVWRKESLQMIPLGLYPGSAEGPIDEIVAYPEYGMCKINIDNRDHPIIHEESDSVWMLYYWGPKLILDKEDNITVLGRYEKSGEPAMISFDYGLGRVFLIAPHPEIEEDSERDCVEFADELDDRGSDWELMGKAVDWCLKKPGFEF